MRNIKLFKILKKSRHINNVNIEQLKQMMIQNPDIVLIDVRSLQEYNEGHLERAINIPFYELDNNINKILQYKEKIIIVYCTAGIKSKKTIKKLEKQGFKNLYNLENGLNG